jgi:hypothetical protein
MKKITLLQLLLCLLVIFSSCSKVEQVKIEPLYQEAYKGGSIKLKVSVTGKGSPDTTVTWNIIETVSPKTTISKDGVLVIADDEQATQITIKASANSDTSKNALLNVKLALNPAYFYGKWEIYKQGSLMKVIIDSSAWEAFYPGNSWHYKIGSLTWTAVSNNDPTTSKLYPEGYMIVGKSSEVRNIANFDNNQIHSFSLFLAKDKNSFMRIEKGNNNLYVFNKSK